mmetsp:Transcript_34979/g.76963  ORF Transcript_34979/g.76963 Transcript_34979/m.76963 type:complete len:328 (-) Transcript_34979:371-1354(-)
MEVLLRAYPGAARELFPDGSSPLQWALATGASEEVLLLLLDANRDAARDVCKEGSGTLHLAVRRKYSANVVSSLLQIFPGGARHADKDGRLPLHAAARHAAAADVVEILLRAFPRGARQKDYRRLLPLHFALEHKASERVVALLLQFFPKGVQLKNERGEFPLHAAARTDVPEQSMVKLYNAYPRAAAGLPDEVRLRLKELAKKKSFLSADVTPVEAAERKHYLALKQPQCNLRTGQHALDRHDKEGLMSRMRRVVAERISGSSACSFESRGTASLDRDDAATFAAASTSASLRDWQAATAASASFREPQGTQVLQRANQPHIRLKT